MRQLTSISFSVLLFLVLSGCGSLSYYFEQSIPGHFGLMLKMQEIDVVLHQDVEEKTKEKLKLVVKARHYASEKLGLPENDSYLYYADIERPYVTWNVVAAPALSLKPKTWCYFVIGCAVYRGYFNEQDAKLEADRLDREGLDVHIGGATAYSTLGFFTDPVLNTMMAWQDYQLAGIIFHELSHQVLYLKNDTAFNEAFATSVELIGSIQWIVDQRPEILDAFLAALKRAEEFRQLKQTTRERLKTLYSSTDDERQKRAQKTKIFEEMRSDYEKLKTKWGRAYYASWFDKPLNNARLISDATYWQHVPAFLALYIESDRDWDKFYERCEEIGDLNKEDRENALSKLAAQGVTLPDILKIFI